MESEVDTRCPEIDVEALSSDRDERLADQDTISLAPKACSSEQTRPEFALERVPRIACGVLLLSFRWVVLPAGYRASNRLSQDPCSSYPLATALTVRRFVSAIG